MRRFLAGLLVGVVVATALGAHADSDVPELVTAAAVAHHVSPGWLRSIAWCESRYNRWATNGQYLGLFQLGAGMRQRFRARGYDNPFDPSQSANFAAEIIAAGGARNWTCA